MIRNLTILIFSLVSLSLFAQTVDYSYEDALANDNVRSLAEDIYGNVWIGTIGGITKFDGSSFVSYTTDQGLGSNVIYDIYAHSSGDVYAATAGGLSVFDGATWSNMSIGDGLPSNTIWCVTEDNLGQVWIGTSDVGAAYYDGANWYQLSSADGLVSDGVKSISADRSGNLWFGTGNGLSLYDGVGFTNFNTSTGLPGLLINEIIQLYNGNIAVATNGGIGIYNYYEWNNITTAEGLPTGNVLSIKEDFNQDLWLGCALGLVNYDGVTFTTYDYDDGLTNTIVNKHIITHAGDNKIWAASPFNGVTEFDRNSTYKIYRTNKNLVNDDINTIYVDDEKYTWVGTNGGLNKIDDLHWRTYRSADGLTNDTITCVHKDINGNIWVGTADGLNTVDGETITNFSMVDGLTSNVINGITSDAAGLVYIASPNMITVIDAGVVTDTLSIADGLLSDDINEIHFENGRLWFLADNSIQYYDGAYVDATSSGCAMTPANTKAKCINSASPQYFGTDNTLRSYQNGIITANCYNHGFMGSTIESIVETNDGLVCSFDIGLVETYILGSGWVPNPMPYNVSFLAGIDYDYLWVGYETNGLTKVCNNWSTAIAYTHTIPTCHGVADASINITSPVGVYTYSINNGETWQAATAFNGLYGGTYHILVKDAVNDIIADSVIYIDYYDLITDANITISQIDCASDNNGEIELQYSNLGSHIWENGNSVLYTRTNLLDGTYAVTISDVATCTRILENTIVEPTLIDVSLTFEDVTCFGFGDGSIGLTVTGGTLPYEYEWSNLQTSGEIIDLIPDTYLYTVTDGNGCEATGSRLIDEPDALAISEVLEHVNCFGELNGYIDISVSNGTLPYSIVWDMTDYVDANDDIMAAPAGEYNLVVSDGNSCTLAANYEITQPDLLQIISEDIVDVHCYGESTGEIDLELQGGTGTYYYEWVKEGVGGTFSTNQDLLALSIGTYHITITDDHACEVINTYIIDQSPELDVTLDITPISCAGYEDGSILAIASGGSGTYSAYYWYDVDDNIIGVNPDITGLGEGYYEVVVRDSYYCYDTAFTTLTQAIPHVYEISSGPMTCNGLEDGEITVIVDGGAGAGFEFVWQDAIAGNTNQAINVGEGEWFVTITDPTDCVEILSAEVEEPIMEDIGAFTDVEFICYGSTLILDPGMFVSYDWSTGVATPTIEVENEDVYFVEVINASGCHLGDTIQVNISTVFEDEALNLATVTDDGNIKVIWEKTPDQETDFYYIYKDSGTGFELVATKDYDEDAIYEDTDVTPSDEYYSYKLTTVDFCGAESDDSEVHRTCLLNVVANDNGACYLDWSEYQGFFVVYYFIMRGTSPDNLEVVDSTLYNDFNYVQMNPNEDGSYYRIKVRRIDGCSPGDGNYYDEAFSNIVFCDNYVGIVNQAVVEMSAYPNPFDYNLSLDFYLNMSGEVKYSIVNLLGQEIVAVESFEAEAGAQSISINPDIETGIYIIRLEFAGEIHNIKIIKKS